MAGKTKWGHLKGTLPELEHPSAVYQKQLREAVDAMRGMSVGDLTFEINKKTDEKKALEERLKYVGYAIEVAERALEVAMQDAGFDSVVSNGYTWTPTGEPYPQVKDRAALRMWADKNASEALSLNSQTLKSIVKEALESNEPLPDGVEAFWKPSISRKAKES